MTHPEFSREVRLDSLGAGPRAVSIEAEEAERLALARRFDLVAIDRLHAELRLTRTGENVRLEGSLSAAVTQSCIASGEPIPAEISEPFDVTFRPLPSVGHAEEELELDEQELDVVFYSGSSVDVGEAVAETLSLSLDPFPRSAIAEEALRDAGVASETEAAPLGALAGLKNLLEGRKA